ncbi:MAG: Chromate resistance protein ChrB [Acidimicrobiales bacterium]
MPDTDWVLLAYRMPREPSTPRIAVWRKLRRLGAVQLVDGLVALPSDPATVEAFDWLADEVIEAGGEAWTWRAMPGSKQQDRALRERVSTAVVEEFKALILEAKEAGSDASRRTVDRLRRELRAIEGRDRFGVREREQARALIEQLAARLDAPDRESAR